MASMLAAITLMFVCMGSVAADDLQPCSKLTLTCAELITTGSGVEVTGDYCEYVRETKEKGRARFLDLEGQNITAVHRCALSGFTGIMSLQLGFNRIQQLPDGLLNSIDYSIVNSFRLGLKQNLISKVEDVTQALCTHVPRFEEDCNVVGLNLAGNSIESLDANSLDRLTKTFDLKLDLSNNGMSMIAPNVFDKLNYLDSINLSGNRLLHVPRFNFTAYHGLGRIIDLSANSISEISPGELGQVSSVMQLYLNSNRITDLSFLSTQTFGSPLETLVLSDNEIQCLSAGIFGSLHQLVFLSLDSNNITTIADEAFRGLDKLNNLDLSHNPGLKCIPVPPPVFKLLGPGPCKDPAAAAQSMPAWAYAVFAVGAAVVVAVIYSYVVRGQQEKQDTDRYVSV